MHTRVLGILAVAAAFGGMAQAACVNGSVIEGKKRVCAIQYFGKTVRAARKYIETHDDQVLTFDEADGFYELNGADLEINAPYIELIGHVSIRAFNPADPPLSFSPPEKAGRGPDQPAGGMNGRNGANGAAGGEGGAGTAGHEGKAAGRVRLNVLHIVGSGGLTIDNGGSPGGPGGEGGDGGNGGPGGKGIDRSGCYGCGLLNPCCSDPPGDGGWGGDGGPGGTGAPGGPGGAGGPIEYNRETAQFITGGRIVPRAVGGAPGPSAQGGLGGAGGRRGDGGSGSNAGGGGSPGRRTPGVDADGVDRRGERRGSLPPMNKGADGKVLCYSCQ